MMDIRLSFQYSSLRETEEYVEFDVVAITASSAYSSVSLSELE
jgi:hypothetical protein